MLLHLDTIILSIEITVSGDIKKWSLCVGCVLIRYTVYLIPFCISCENSEASPLVFFAQLAAWYQISPKYSVI
jgi:hypothetical protein